MRSTHLSASRRLSSKSLGTLQGARQFAEETDERKGDLTRQAFSDGVFAIAITLLVLQFEVPHLSSHTTNSQLSSSLWALWPSGVAFTVSFAAILIMWVNHHGLFNLIQSVDRPFLFANGFLLFVITFVPFPTAVLAEYLNQPAANSAAALYCGTYVVLNMGFNLVWCTALANRRLVKEVVTNERIRTIRNAYLFAFPVYVVATLAALYSAAIGLVICSSMWVVWARLDYRPAAESRQPRVEGEESCPGN